MKTEKRFRNKFGMTKKIAGIAMILAAAASTSAFAASKNGTQKSQSA